MKFAEKLLTTKSIYQGRIINLEEQTVELPNGQTAQREIVRHHGAVALLCLTAAKDKIILVRQWRQPINKTTLEIPAGKIEAAEEPLVTARRELNEETRLAAKQLEQIAVFYTSPGFADEKMYLYVAHDLRPVKNQLPQDDDEFLELVELTMEETDQAIAAGEICDSKTLMAIWYWKLLKTQTKG
ncbi:MAG: NUDIX hydrolase [Liquorilactobacillus ghanensis]|jgi:ADP-ribose pyrophosphatase|uniref:ADP-ribose pyrophosphatase n=1 Tax=Liquorilactobacillus ghanensis DSM 18630 TaxID=1423750 RepID=A0A0R1W0B8_9LACO|nr:NUDIX hydrolase [Liquorilactobacillus ghanensis]KRM07676.1 ADP-ribose pyrophosphatase [Liquorilactobacillus ghanensis DSM 18630]